MNDVKSLKDKWPEIVTLHGHWTPTTEDKFDQNLHELIDLATRIVSEKIESGEFEPLKQSKYIPERITNLLKSNDHYINRLDNLRVNYRDVVRRYIDLSNNRKQTDWANTWDHLKNWVYRTATGITLAAIILGTVIIADGLGLQIPLIRMG